MPASRCRNVIVVQLPASKKAVARPGVSERVYSCLFLQLTRIGLSPHRVNAQMLAQTHARTRPRAEIWLRRQGSFFASTGWANLSHIILHSPSEHAINGKRFALEVQFFHTDNTGRALVVSQLYEVRAFSRRLRARVFVLDNSRCTSFGDFRRVMLTTRSKR
jgi:hypothetical protein